jgi:hypothetical protein
MTYLPTTHKNVIFYNNFKNKLFKSKQKFDQWIGSLFASQMISQK